MCEARLRAALLIEKRPPPELMQNEEPDGATVGVLAQSRKSDTNVARRPSLGDEEESMLLVLQGQNEHSLPADVGAFDHKYDDMFQSMFDRYDLDGSGKINNVEEFDMLTTNIAFRMELHLDVKQLAVLVESLDDPIDYDLPAYRKWFADNLQKFTNNSQGYR